MIGWGCCVGDWRRYYANAWTWPGTVVARFGQTSIAASYNSILDQYAPGVRTGELAAVALAHDDLEITDADVEAKILDAIAPDREHRRRGNADVALVGVAGGGSDGDTTLSWWDHDPIGHQRTDSTLIDFGARTGDVDILEGSLLVFSLWAVEHLRFDEIPGFHGYDAIAAAARAAGKRCVVADIDTHHHTRIGFDTPESAAEWRRGVDRFRARWGRR